MAGASDSSPESTLALSETMTAAAAEIATRRGELLKSRNASSKSDDMHTDRCGVIRACGAIRAMLAGHVTGEKAMTVDMLASTSGDIGVTQENHGP